LFVEMKHTSMLTIF